LDADPSGVFPLEPLPRTPFPVSVRSGFIPPWTSSPSEFLTTSRPSDPSVGNPTLLRSRHPSTTSPERAPVGAGFRPPPPRFRPQVFATSRRFPGRFELAALFRAAAVPGLPLPSEPRLAEIAHPSPGRLLPCGHPRATCARSRGLVTTGFPRRRPRLRGPCRSPPAAMGFLSARRPWRARLPVTLDRAQRARARPRGSSASKPHSPCKARVADPAGLPAGATVLSWVFRPSRAFSTRPLDPLADPPRPRSEVRPTPRLLATPAATSGISRPPGRVNLVGRPVKDVRQTRRRSQPVMDWSAPPLRRRSFSHGLGHTQRRPRARPDPRSFSVNG